MSRSRPAPSSPDPAPASQRSSLLHRFERDMEELQVAAATKESPRAALGALFAGDGLQILALQRLRESFQCRERGTFMGHILRRLQTTLFGIEISKHATIGAGTYFVHPLGVVIGGDSVVGERVRFYGNNTLGTVWDNGYPRIGDDVIIGTGARILGPVTVGAGAVIGANAVVLDSIPPYEKAAGVPARLLSRTSALRPCGGGQ